MITKNQVINEVIHHVRLALENRLQDELYGEYLSGSVSFRINLVAKKKYTMTVDLPQKREMPKEKKLKVEFERRYTRW